MKKKTSHSRSRKFKVLKTKICKDERHIKVFFIHQLTHKRIVLKTILIYIKIDIKTAPTYFGAVTPSSGSTLLVLAEVTVVKIIN